MITYEYLKNHQLIDALNEPFDFFYLIMRVNGNFCNDDVSCTQKKTLEIVHDFLESGLFEILDVNDIPWNLPPNTAIAKIKNIWDASNVNGRANRDDIKMWIYFTLTEKGKAEAKNFWLKHIHAREQVLLSMVDKPYITILDVIKMVKENLPINNAEELQLETISVLNYLWGNEQLADIGDLNEAGQFIPWQGDLRKEIEKRWNAVEGEPKNEVAWLRITPHAKKLVEEWKAKGGHLVDRWYGLID